MDKVGVGDVIAGVGDFSCSEFVTLFGVFDVVVIGGVFVPDDAPTGEVESFGRIGVDAGEEIAVVATARAIIVCFAATCAGVEVDLDELEFWSHGACGCVHDEKETIARLLDGLEEIGAAE